MGSNIVGLFWFNASWNSLFHKYLVLESYFRDIVLYIASYPIAQKYLDKSPKLGSILNKIASSYSNPNQCCNYHRYRLQSTVQSHHKCVLTGNLSLSLSLSLRSVCRYLSHHTIFVPVATSALIDLICERKKKVKIVEKNLVIYFHSQYYRNGHF